MSIRAVIFDKDGTLLDFNATFGPAAYHMFADLAGGDAECLRDLAKIGGYDLQRRHFNADSIVLAHATNDYAPPFAERLQVTCDEAFMARIDNQLEAHSMDNVSMFNDTQDTLQRLEDSGYAIGCVTNDTESCARAQLAQAGVAVFFVDIIGYDSGHGRKPDPGQIHAFAKKVDLDYDNIALVGDSVHDMQAARAAGVLGIAVTTGLLDAETLAPHCDHVVSKLSNILPLVGII